MEASRPLDRGGRIFHLPVDIRVDTSVLIDFLRGVSNEKTKKLEFIMKNHTPHGINGFIFQELLQGCRTDKDFRVLKRYLSTQRFYHLKDHRGSYAAAARIYVDLRKKGKTVSGTVDCLIAQTAIENDLFLLHNDDDFSAMKAVIPLKEY
jgi:predicted nucleic acid-binding protein